MNAFTSVLLVETTPSANSAAAVVSVARLAAEDASASSVFARESVTPVRVPEAAKSCLLSHPAAPSSTARPFHLSPA